jgi:hypothetical protein
MLFNELEFYQDVEKMTKAIYGAKELFGENEPYVVERGIDGKVYIFNEHFITTVRGALTNGCMAKMNTDEEELFMAFIDYQNGSGARDITRDDNAVVEALDKWLVNSMNCIPNPVVNACYDAETHTWVECPTIT